MILRLCRKCGTYLPFDDTFFHRNRNALGGLHPNCKACIHESKRRKEARDAALSRPWPPFQRWAVFEVVA